MTYYKLRKDTPTVKAGTKFKVDVRGYDNRGLLARLVPLDTSIGLQWKIRDIDNFDEWFEEIQEPTDSIHWKPECGEEYWVINSYGLIVKRIWSDSNEDLNMYKLGIVHPTKEECGKAHSRELAEVRLRRTSTFKPDFKNGNGGWVVGYDHEEGGLLAMFIDFIDYGEVAHYKTSREAEKSIEENREDWLIYLGVENG